jgi:APA family basic amino acid/polyamine antiporter
MKNWNVRKAVVAREDMPEEHRLRQSLGWPHLVALGVGAIVGTGLLTLIGVGAGKPGPPLSHSFAHARAICASAARA